MASNTRQSWLNGGVITYSSTYGSAERYARALADRTGMPIHSLDEVTSIGSTLVHVGSVFAGKVVGLPEVLTRVPEQTRLIIVSVGMSNPAFQSVAAKLDQSIRAQLQDRDAAIFHLRGDIDYPNLKVRHRAMLAMVHAKMVAIPAEKRDESVIDFLDTYGKSCQFYDASSLDQIVDFLNGPSPASGSRSREPRR